MPIENRRKTKIAVTLKAVRSICKSEGMTRETLHEIEPLLLDLAGDGSLFPEANFGIPADEKIRLYRLAEDEDGGFALYFHTANVPAEVGPHNHTTWACIAGIAGDEENTLYSSCDDKPPVQTETRSVRAGEAISLMPGDVHSIRAAGNVPLKNLHLYGKAIDQLYDRVFWNADLEEWTKIAPTSGIIERRS